jgi:hypothetical protein
MKSGCIRPARPAHACLWPTLVATLTLTGSSQAGDLFILTGTTTDGGPAVNFHESSSRLPRFVSDLVSGSGPFGALQNRSYSAQLNYASVNHALQFDVTQAGTI